MKLFGESCKQMDWAWGGNPADSDQTTAEDDILRTKLSLQSQQGHQLSMPPSSFLSAPDLKADFPQEPKTVSKITTTTTTSANIPSCYVYNWYVLDKGPYWLAYVFTGFFDS